MPEKRFLLPLLLLVLPRDVHKGGNRGGLRACASRALQQQIAAVPQCNNGTTTARGAVTSIFHARHRLLVEIHPASSTLYKGQLAILR